MTTLLEIKPYIRNFIVENLDSVFRDKVYWIGERVNIPNYPDCLLSVIAENKDKRTSRHDGRLIEFIESGQSNAQELREKIITRYKTCTITVGIYNAWVQDTYDTEDMDIAKEYAYAQIDLLEGLFEDYPINKKFSVQSISPIRPLHEPVPGGYMYRFEFDLTIGYNEPVIVDKNIGKIVDAEIDVIHADESEPPEKIDFIVTVDSENEIVYTDIG